MARRRTIKRRGWPENLYETRGYFIWRNPIDGKKHGLGRDKASASLQAIEANLHIAGMLTKSRLIDRVLGGEDQSVAAWCGRYAKILEDRTLADETRREFNRRIGKIKETLGSHQVDKVTTKHIADFLRPWTDDGKKRMAQAMRSLMLDMFREAVAAGWAKQNPVAVTRAPRVAVARARLTLDMFLAIHAVALRDHSPWVARSMELALVSAQRREDVALMGRKDMRDGRLWITQEKTGTRVSIPTDLRLQAVNWSVEDVIQRCHDKVLAPTFIHHSAHAGMAKPGDKVRLHSITAAFAEARDTARAEGCIQWGDDKTPPTFHEIRSLAARLYAEQGVDAQALLGHKSPDMTAVYRDVRGAEWIDVKAG
ncbi:MAG: phage integrase Arm DNA-binding domain-containing protein [Magnetospirillum sp.]|nr:phage integrase Arm DNA-binding domain-containing protein [Magnetospirillum sp.]